MASRNKRMPWPPPNDMRGFHDGPPPPLPRGRGPGLGPMPPHPLEAELAYRDDDIQRIIADNRLIMEDIAALRRDLPLIREEIHVLTNQAIPRLHAEKELESRDVIQRGLKMEAEMHALEPIKAEVLHLRSEGQNLEALREELVSKVQALSQELMHLQSENQHIPAMRTELQGLREELVRARAAYEYEKKANAELLEQRQVMERDFLSMNREAEKLKVELESRATMRPGGFYPPPYSFGPY